MSKEFSFTTVTGKEFSFSIPDPAISNSFFVFSLPKAGSTLLMNVMADVCKNINIPTVDLPTKLFNLDIKPAELADDINCLWQDKGYAYTGFRSYPPSMQFDFLKTKNILLVRDPRDMLVSLFFSMKYSHVVPNKEKKGTHSIEKQRSKLQKIDIDEAVLKNVHAYKNYFQTYMNKLPASTTRIYRYEDIIFKKKEWLYDMLDFLELELDEKIVTAIVEKYDIRPDNEDPRKHIRQVIPGNYKLHLSKETISRLNQLFYPEINCFQYDSVVSFNINSDDKGLSQQNLYGASDDSIVSHFQKLQTDIDAIHQSWSWRLTGPLRTLYSKFKKA